MNKQTLEQQLTAGVNINFISIDAPTYITNKI